MPSSALKRTAPAHLSVVPSPRLAVETARPELAPEEELEQLWRHEEELRRKLAVNAALQVDAVRRYRDKHRLGFIPRLETVKAALTRKPETVR